MAAKLRSATFTWLEVLLMAFNATKLTADAALDANYDEKRVLQLLAARPSYCNWTRRESAPSRELFCSGACLPPPFPSHGHTGKTGRHAASAARSPNCAAALLFLAQAFRHPARTEWVCENDCIDGIKITHGHAQL